MADLTQGPYLEDLSISDRLARLGYGHRKVEKVSGQRVWKTYAREVYRIGTGEVVRFFTADEAVTFLTENGG